MDPGGRLERAAHSDHATIGDLALFVWSFFCVGIVAFPIGILSGCMGAAHFLNRQGRESTIAECLKIVLPKAWPLWLFHWIDGWWTVQRILDRLPKKNDRRSLADKASSELLYYAWKVATIGILPGLVTGRGLMDAGRRSVGLVKSRFRDVIILRAGYSTLCWALGVAAYAGTIYFFMTFPGLVDWNRSVAGQLYVFYFWVGVPLLSAVGLVMLLLRPIYVISACNIYADHVAKLEENLMLPPPPAQAGGGALETLLVLFLALLAVAFFRDELGLTRLLAR